MQDLTWSCRVCGAVRPDAKISVASAEGEHNGVKITFNERYCNDREDCHDAAHERAEVLALHYSSGGNFLANNY